MRTDSNSILSLPSGVPPKKPANTKSVASNGATFASDFNKAKETINAKKATNSESSSSSSQAESPKNTKGESDNGATAVTGSDKGKSTQSTEVEGKNASSHSGKSLQQEGEEFPVEGSSSADLVASGPMATKVKATVQENGLAENLDQPNLVGFEAGDMSQAPQTATALTQGEGDDSEGESQSPEALLTSKSDSSLVDAGGVLGLASLKRQVSKESTELGQSSSKNSEGSVDPFVAEAEGADDQLTWVLSQMGVSGVKAATAETTGHSNLDASKTAVAAGVMAAAVDKPGRSEHLTASLLASADSSQTGEEGLDTADSLLGEDGLMINEPIELRKKEHEAMLSRMTAQLDGGFSDDSSPGGLNSSLHNNINRPAAAALNAAVSNPQANNLTMSLPPGHPGWANEMSQKVAWIARDGGHTAHIRLDPPELGSLTVKVSVDSDSNTQISFIAATPQARDLLEGQMGRLREMLAQQGMDLSRADVDVSQQDTSGAQDRANDRNTAQSRESFASNDELDDELVPRNLSYVSATGVDYYA